MLAPSHSQDLLGILVDLGNEGSLGSATSVMSKKTEIRAEINGGRERVLLLHHKEGAGEG